MMICTCSVHTRITCSGCRRASAWLNVVSAFIRALTICTIFYCWLLIRRYALSRLCGQKDAVATLCAAICVSFVAAKVMGDNCAIVWSRRGECGDLVCSQFNVSYPQCLHPVPTGGACDLFSDCAPVLVCRKNECSASRGLGQKCGNALVCDDREGLTCDIDGTKTCVAWRGDGEKCAHKLQCATGSWCDDGTCAERRGVGEACRNFYSCKTGTMCVEGACVADPGKGDACSTHKSKPRVGLRSRKYSACASNMKCKDSRCALRGRAKLMRLVRLMLRLRLMARVRLVQ